MGGKFFKRKKEGKKDDKGRKYYNFTAYIPNGIKELKFEPEERSLGVRKLFTNFINGDYELLKELIKDNTDMGQFCVNISNEMIGVIEELKKKRVFTSKNEAFKFIIISQLINEMRNKK